MSEPVLAPLYEGILASGSFEDALARSLVKRLSHPSVPAEELKNMLLEPLLTDGSVAEAARADLSAVVERDPASDRLLEPFLFFKGYAAIQTHRLTHWLWNAGKRDIALYLQSRSSEIFQTDIHPGAQIGKGVFLDHATGFVAGETVVIEDNVSILHGVTLGGTGTEKIDRHPKIRTGVLIGAGAQIIGNIEIGAYSRIAAGSFVTQPVPPRCTAVGVPARILKGAGTDNPAQTMDETLAQGTYESFTYVI
jgi:serine O-acetyltransferase